MKVILLQDIAKLGRRFDVAEVPDGYAQNKLIPQRLAEPATKASMKRLEAHAQKTADEQASREAAFDAALEKLSGGEIELAVEANEKGHLFKGVNEHDVSACLAERGIELPAESVLMDKAIKEIGSHEVTLQQGEQKGSFILSVVAKK